MYKDLCNDIRRLIVVYILSIPLEAWLSGRAESTADFQMDLFNDIMSIMFYYEIMKHIPQRTSNLSNSMFKTIILLLVNNYLTLGYIDYNKVLITTLINGSYHLLGKPIISKLKINNKFEDSLETIIILSIANNSLPDTLAKTISLFLFHNFLKW